MIHGSIYIELHKETNSVALIINRHYHVPYDMPQMVIPHSITLMAWT